MKKLIKWIIRLLLVVVVLVVVAAVVLPLVIDPNDYKDKIENTIAENIGRKAHLNGEIEWSVFPWVALTFNDVTIDNEKGFKGDHLASIQQLSARVKLLPLLSKNIEVGRVSLDDAHVNLQVAKNGNSNWQNILKALESDQASSGSETESQSTGSSTLNIKGVGLNNITINYNDAQSKTSAKISKLTLDIGQIASQVPTSIKGDMHVLVPESGLDIDFSTDIIAEHLLDSQAIQVEVNDFTITGKMSTDSVLPINIKLEEKGQIDLAKDSLSLPAIVLAFGEAQLNTNLTGQNISSDMKLSGSYNLSPFDLNALVTNMTGTSVVHNDVLADFASSGTWSFQGKRLSIAELKILFDETIIKGDADIKNLDDMQGNFNVHINQLNVDDFLGEGETTNTQVAENTIDQKPLEFGRLSGNIKIDTLSASGASMSNVNVDVKTNKTKMSLLPVKADFYQGLLVTEVKVDTAATTKKVQVVHKMDKIQAGPLITDLAGSELLTGIGNLNMDVNIDDPFSAAPLKTAHGKITYQLGKGAIYGIDVFGMMQQGLGLLYPDLQQNANDDGVKKTTFALMEIDADIDEGVLKTNVLSIQSPYLEVTGDVVIDLDQMTIKGTIEPMLLDLPEQLVSDDYRKLLNFPFPVSLEGSLLEPEIKIDAKKLLLASQKKRIDKEKDKLKGKLLDSLFGKDDKKSDSEGGSTDGGEQTQEKKTSDKDKLKKELLKGLFGSDKDKDDDGS